VVVVVVPAAAVAVGYLSRAHRAPAVRAGESVSLHGGKVTFRAPDGWTRPGCPSGDTADCVMLLAPGGDPTATGDSINAIVSTPDAKAPEGDLSLLLLDPTVGAAPGATYFTRDGVRFVRMHTDTGTAVDPESATTLVLGSLPNGDRVILTCIEKTEPALVRAGCDIVVNSLRIST
jgi:hypothetical protein